MFVVMLIYSISEKRKILSNKILTFIGKYCLEIYLSHMMIFRMLEKMHLTHVLPHEVTSYTAIYFMTVGGTLCFSVVVSNIINVALSRIGELGKNKA